MSAIIDPNSVTPMYKQVLKILSDRITSGQLKPGDKLPSETALMSEFGVSRITVRAAIIELAEDGILVRSQGKGTFVATPKSTYKANDTIGFSHSCRLAGKVPSSRLIYSDWIYPSQKDMDFFKIKETEKIICTKRLRYVDNIPTLIEINHYSPQLTFLFTENLEGSLFEIFGKHGITITNSMRSLEICFPTKEEIILLNLKKDTPLLLFKDVQKDAKGKPLYLSKQLYNTEHMKFYF